MIAITRHLTRAPMIWDNDVTEVSDAPQPVELLVCVKCRKGNDIPTDDRRPGEVLFEGLKTAGMPDGVRLTAVECLQNCDLGCTVALRGGDRWTYVFGNVDEASHVDLLVDGVARYRDAKDGLIPWRQRPDHFKKNCIARIPPLETSNG